MADEHPLAQVWLAVLRKRHPLARWLDSEHPYSALPTEFPSGPSPRQLIASHPFTDFHPWLSQAISPGSSSTPRG